MLRTAAWVAILAGVACVAQRRPRPEPLPDWPQFGWDAAIPTGVTAANAGALIRRQVTLDGTVDASAIYLHGVTIHGASHDAFFLTTSYGKTIAVDADNGSVLWEYTPPGIAAWLGTAQITNSTPAADQDRQHLYAAAPDGAVRRLAIEDGHAEWTTAITLLPSREKIASPLKQFRGRIIALTGGYVGDAPPYLGHVAVLDAQSGALVSVWNSLCSDRPGLIDPASCASTRSAIWGRAGATIDPATGNLFVATGNGPYNGKTDWGDSIIELDPEAKQILANYTPTDNSVLEGSDLDLGSTSPVLLGAGIVAQGGKDASIRLVDTSNIAGTKPHTDGELQTVPTPSGNRLYAALAVWRDRTETWLFAADAGGTQGWKASNGRLTPGWKNTTGGTSPVAAGGLLYVYNPNGGLHVYDPRTGTEVAMLACGGGHWNSPIVADGRIALPEGNANDHSSSGVLNIWSVASR
jgi:outer membrane protein assembly factor BamB